MYMIGLVVAPLMALLLKRTLLRGDTPVFVMEMPLYKWPSPRTVCRRITDSALAFVRRAGTLILAAMVVVWALLYFPYTDLAGHSYPEQMAALEEQVSGQQAEQQKVDEKVRELEQAWKRNSYLGRMGQTIEPAVRPLGWDWRIGVAVLASFPAREVVVGTLGVIYKQGKVESDDIRAADLSDISDTGLGKALREAEHDDGQPVFTVPVALSLMVFFALCCQCASTLVIIRRETNSWRWPLFTFTYMTVLAYFGALVVYQVGSWLT
jgi:ferrous iron transport protein B